jgi:hypothetical protein
MHSTVKHFGMEISPLNFKAKASTRSKIVMDNSIYVGTSKCFDIFGMYNFIRRGKRNYSKLSKFLQIFGNYNHI